jgi:hypothetical protein
MGSLHQPMGSLHLPMGSPKPRPSPLRPHPCGDGPALSSAGCIAALSRRRWVRHITGCTRGAAAAAAAAAAATGCTPGECGHAQQQ